MGQGIEVFNSAGQLVFDATTRLTRTIGQITVAAGSTGSVVVPAIQGLPFVFVHMLSGVSYYLPTISVSGQTISWSPNTTYPGGMVDVVLNYGAF